VGRYHGQYHYTDGDTGRDDDWENRRTRIGMKVSMLEKKLTLNFEVQSNDQYDPAYNDMTDVYLDYKPKGDGINWRIGKWQPHFGHEFGISSREILTFERSAFINQYGINFTPGARVGGKHGNWSWYLAAFSNSTDKEFGKFDGGWSTLATIGYNAKEALGWDKADFRLDYLHSDHEEGDNRLNFFDDSVSVSFSGQNGKWGLNTDLIGALSDRGDALHFLIMPTYNVTEKFQLVARYNVSVASESNTLASLRRYERAVDVPSGDLYQAAYLGFNYYIYGHKLKFMGGLEYSNMSGGSEDAGTLTLLTGLRLYF
jgi:phosphate-selective porin OprO and OprP